MVLVISKYIALKTGISIKKQLDESKEIVEGQILNHITNKVVSIKTQSSQAMNFISAKLFPPH